MLLKYRDDYQKIVMGILSLSPNSDKMNYLQQEFSWYQHNPKSRHIYLWKDQFNNWAGMIGVEVNKTNVVIRRITLTPDDNNVFNIFRILDDISGLYPKKKLMGSFATNNVIAKWELQNDQKKLRNSYKRF